MSNLLIKEPPLQVLPTLAKLIGLNEAIILQQLHYWVENKNSAGEIDDDGNKWIYNSYPEWKKDNFPFWSVSTIKRAFLNLEKGKLVISAQLKANQRDMTKYYRINYELLDTMQEFNVTPSIHAKRSDVNHIPETTPRVVKKEKKAATPQPPEIILFREVVKHYPKQAQRELVIGAIQKIALRLQREVTTLDLQPFWEKWATVSGNEWSLVWLLEWAVSGTFPGQRQNGIVNKVAEKWNTVNNAFEALKQSEGWA
jgi:hypothetical protein